MAHDRIPIRRRNPTRQKDQAMRCEKDNLHGHNADASLYWEAVYGGYGWTDYNYGYTCYGHEPSWQQVEIPDGGQMIQFRVQELETGKVIDEYNPLGYEWSNTE